MPHGDKVAYLDVRYFILRMEYTAILDITVLTNLNAVYIASKYGIEPHACVVAQGYISYNPRPIGYETIFADGRRKATYRYNIFIHTGLEFLSFSS